MPEGLEVELYRRAVAPLVGGRITVVDVDVRTSIGPVAAALTGRRIVEVGRIGKHLLVGTDGPTLGLHFGMTGRIVVGDAAPIDRLVYGAGRDDPAWDRVRMEVAGPAGPTVVRVNDPRRWSRSQLDPDVSRLGPDLLEVDVDWLVEALGRRRSALKSVLLDQSVVAGLGNMCVDELLWQVGLAPDRSAADLERGAVRVLWEAMRVHLPAMLARGGSHTGTISPDVRAAVPECPRDGASLRRTKVAGRTTIWCPAHQH